MSRIENEKQLLNYFFMEQKHFFKRCSLTKPVIFLLFLFMTTSTAFAQITVNLQNRPLRETLKEIEKVSDYKFFYNESLPDLEKIVSLQVTNAGIDEAMKFLLSGTSIEYRKGEKNIIALVEKNASEGQQKSPAQSRKRPVKGRVADASGEPVTGVTIVEKANPLNGTITDVDGHFTIDVQSDAVLRISYIGYRDQEIPTAGKTSFDIVMHEDTKQLDEVVVVGYGVQKKVNIIGSIAQVDGEKISQRTNANITNALTGMMSGVTIIQGSGAPGNPSNSVQIRGVGSFGASPTALVLVDGIPGSLADINPAEIESISVLKDASTAAIYGARAANGVILITTKSGKEGKVQVSYNGYVGFNRPTAFPDLVPTWEYAQLLNEASNSTVYTDEQIAKFKDGSDPDHYANENYLKRVFDRDGLQTSHDLNINGGGKTTRYLLTFGYLKQNGLIAKNDYTRYNARVNLTTELLLNLKLTTRINGVMSERNEPAIPAGDDADDMEGIIIKALRFPGVTPVKLSDGTYGKGQEVHGTPPAWIESPSFYSLPQYKTTANVSLTYQPLELLELTAMGGITYGNYEEKRFRSTLKIEGGRVLGPSFLENRMQRSLYKTFQATANYGRKIGQHNFSLLAGYSFEDYSDRWLKGFRDNFASNDLPYLDVGAPDNQKADGAGQEWALQSLFGRLNYNYAERYLLETTMRYDGSSRFPKSKKYGFFPSVALGWRLSEETFIRENEKMSWLTNLKLKASWGVLGNQNIGIYPYQTLYDLGRNYPFGNTFSSGASITTLTDPNLRWESTRTWDMGFESSLWNGLLSFNVAYFNRYTYDILYAPSGSVSSVLGLNISPINTGSLTNRGLELEIGHHLSSGDFTLDVQGNFNIVQNEIETLGVGDVKQLNGLVGSGGLYIGHPMQVYYGYQTDGVFLDADDVKTWADQTKVTPKAQVGDIRYKDINGPDGVPDGKVDPNYDRVVLGTRIPKYTFGLGIQTSYKEFDAAVQMQGVAGVKGMLSGVAGFAMWQEGNVQRWQADGRFRSDSPERYPSYPRLETVSGGGSPNTEVSDFWVRDASYLRVRNVQLGYTLPKQWLHALHISGVRIYVSGENLLTLSGYPRGWDPEINTNGRYYPIQQTYTLGLNIKF